MNHINITREREKKTHTHTHPTNFLISSQNLTKIFNVQLFSRFIFASPIPTLYIILNIEIILKREMEKRATQPDSTRNHFHIRQTLRVPAPPSPATSQNEVKHHILDISGP